MLQGVFSNRRQLLLLPLRRGQGAWPLLLPLLSATGTTAAAGLGHAAGMLLWQPVHRVNLRTLIITRVAAARVCKGLGSCRRRGSKCAGWRWCGHVSKLPWREQHVARQHKSTHLHPLNGDAERSCARRRWFGACGRLHPRSGLAQVVLLHPATSEARQTLHRAVRDAGLR